MRLFRLMVTETILKQFWVLSFIFNYSGWRSQLAKTSELGLGLILKLSGCKRFLLSGPQSSHEGRKGTGWLVCNFRI